MMISNFTKLRKEQTHKKVIRIVINECSNIIHMTDIWKKKKMNHEAPYIHGTIKEHKENKAIRPVVN
jgi:hypothetical protein